MTDLQLPRIAGLPLPGGSDHDRGIGGWSAVVAGLPSHLPQDAQQDWGDMLDAVKVRLRQSVNQPLLTLTAAHALQDALRMRREVLDCVAALDLLHPLSWPAQGQTGPGRPGRRADRSSGPDGDRRAGRACGADPRPAPPDDAGLEGWLIASLAASMPLALMVLELDGWDVLADPAQAQATSQVRRIVAARVAGVLRATDKTGHLPDQTLGCLLRGEHSEDQLWRRAGHLLDVVSAPLRVGTLELRLLPSIGIACAPGDSASAAGLVRCAEAALQRARRRRTGLARFDRRIDT